MTEHAGRLCKRSRRVCEGCDRVIEADAPDAFRVIRPGHWDERFSAPAARRDRGRWRLRGLSRRERKGRLMLMKADAVDGARAVPERFLLQRKASRWLSVASPLLRMSASPSMLAKSSGRLVGQEQGREDHARACLAGNCLPYRPGGSRGKPGIPEGYVPQRFPIEQNSPAFRSGRCSCP